MIDSVYQSMLEEAANGNVDALHCAVLASSYFHTFDDLIDGDVEFNARNAVTCSNLLKRLVTCKFFKEYHSILMTQMILIGEEYVASEEHPRTWSMLRHNGTNFIRVIALLTGGEELLNTVSKKLRDYIVIKENYAS